MANMIILAGLAFACFMVNCCNSNYIDDRQKQESWNVRLTCGGYS